MDIDNLILLRGGFKTNNRPESLRAVDGSSGYYSGPYLKHMVSPDSLVPDPYNSLDYNRYAYARYNPLKYTDSTGHVPEWFYTVLGATAQYLDDVSLGLFSHVAGSLDVVGNKAYQDGRSYGRDVAIVQSSAETVVGAYVAAASAAAMGPTAGGGAACAVASGGVCAIPAGVTITAEAAGVVGGTVVAGHGALMAAKMDGDPYGNGYDTSDPYYIQGKPYTSADLNGAVRIRKDIENVTSGVFPDFIRSQGKGFKSNEWTKVMETWELPDGTVVENHYWRHKSGETWFHK